MKLKAVIATKNKGKLKELQNLLSDFGLEIVSLDEFDEIGEIVEDGDTFFENAMKKARTVAERTGLLAIADDSGLEVDCLNGRPGIYSARFAGENCSDQDNNQKLLSEMKDVPAEKRGAQFRCVIVAYRPDGKWVSAEGVCRGTIGFEPVGDQGFGYDPLFIPEGEDRTMAQMTREEKNKISHRGKALQDLKSKIEQIIQ
ncbi:MAG: XTP/dITP diphosphatase [Thermodesulfobacteria bacterium]|nr:XTP/dITP diphosphatase [Thermodesulfobacteriota bacterium]